MAPQPKGGINDQHETLGDLLGLLDSSPVPRDSAPFTGLEQIDVSLTWDELSVANEGIGQLSNHPYLGPRTHNYKQCQNCAENGIIVWVVPGKCCQECGAYVD